MSQYIGSATYDPQDNKIRFYPFARLDAETYGRVKDAGYSWAPKQDCFIAPMWTPAREDLALELAGEIDDEDTSLVDRAEARADRFEDYSERRQAESDAAHAEVDRIAHMVNGNPILVGHHSEKRARRDQQRIFDGMDKAVSLWRTAQYWQERAQAAIAHAKYKERPDVRARRIKGLEADLRKQERNKEDAEKYLHLWQTIPLDYQNARNLTNYDHVSMCFPLDTYPRESPASQYEGSMGLWSALEGIITPEQARDIAIKAHQAYLIPCQRWIQHYENRLTYERALLAADGGTIADRTTPEKGGAVRCWVQGGKWIEIVKVNKVSVTVYDNWGNGGPDFTRTVPFDHLKAIMSKADFDAMQAQA